MVTTLIGLLVLILLGVVAVVGHRVVYGPPTFSQRGFGKVASRCLTWLGALLLLVFLGFLLFGAVRWVWRGLFS
jgi:hypothetical protein